MMASTIIEQRLYQQRLANHACTSPAEVVTWFGAVQAQDYMASLWAVGLRMQNATAQDVERAIADKSIIRTWFMRGTIHFVPGPDIRWMLDLVRPRLNMLLNNTVRYQRLELDPVTVTKSFDALVKALEGGKQCTRAELNAALEQAGIATRELRGLFILQRAQMAGLLCQAARRGKQFTFALLDEWVPAAPQKERDEALAEFARRYFTSHGPATLRDFVWWTGLTTTEARAGLEMAKAFLAQEVVDGQTYWLAASRPRAQDIAATAYLLPNFDEYMVGYKDRSMLLDEKSQVTPSNMQVLSHTIILGGRIAGNWRRTLHKDTVVIEAKPFRKLTAAEERAFASAAQRYGKFLGMPVVLA